MDTRSLNGNGQGRCFGFMVNVRVSPFHFRISYKDSVLQRGQERPFFRMQFSIYTFSND